MQTIKVFILDDDRFTVSRLSNLLSKKPFVRIVGEELSSAKALPLILSNKPDLIFLDIEMPRINGFTLIGKIRSSEYSPAFIMVTGYQKYALEALRNAAFDYLLKPIDPDDLDRVLNRYIQEKNQDVNYPDPINSLTHREFEVFSYMLKGWTSKQISTELNISGNTVNTHRRRILHKLNLCSTTELILRYSTVAMK